MGNICLISNNPLALGRYPALGQPPGEAVTGGVAEVFTAARDRIHRGAKLINHPLSGSVKPNQSPYKSLLLSHEAPGLVDFASLALIEGAFATLAKLTPLNRQYSERVLEDFQVIDLDLLESAIKALAAEYHM